MLTDYLDPSQTNDPQILDDMEEHLGQPCALCNAPGEHVGAWLVSHESDPHLAQAFGLDDGTTRLVYFTTCDHHRIEGEHAAEYFELAKRDIRKHVGNHSPMEVAGQPKRHATTTAEADLRHQGSPEPKTSSPRLMPQEVHIRLAQLAERSGVHGRLLDHVREMQAEAEREASEARSKNRRRLAATFVAISKVWAEAVQAGDAHLAVEAAYIMAGLASKLWKRPRN